jgi:NDP-sugar pyrophosphorylase family protein
MNIIIPLGGKGDRFIKEGYNSPKPLIEIFNKHMIFYVLDNLKIDKDDKVFIIYKDNLDDYNFSNIISSKYPFINLLSINYQTKGAVETIYNGLDWIKTLSSNRTCVLLDCDTFYTQNIVSIFRNSTDSKSRYRV